MGDRKERTFRQLLILFKKENKEQILGKYASDLYRLQAELAEHGVKTEWNFYEEKEFAFHVQQNILAQDVTDNPYLQHDSLFLTDSPHMLAILKLWGLYAVALLHEENRNASFPDARFVLEGLEGADYKYLQRVYQRFAGLPWEILVTEHLRVRESTVEDVEEFYRIYKEPSITYYMENLFPDPEMEKAYMRNYIRRIYDFYGYGLWTVLCRETGQVIGRAGVSVRDGYELPELGFVIEAAHQRKGYAWEVCTAILQYAREELQMEGLQALVCAENEASVRLLAKLGFEDLGEVKEDGQTYHRWVKMFKK